MELGELQRAMLAVSGDPTLSHMAARLYTHLLARAVDWVVAPPPAGHMAAALGCSERHLYRALAELVDRGLVEPLAPRSTRPQYRMHPACDTRRQGQSTDPGVSLLTPASQTPASVARHRRQSPSPSPDGHIADLASGRQNSRGDITPSRARARVIITSPPERGSETERDTPLSESGAEREAPPQSTALTTEGSGNDRENAAAYAAAARDFARATATRGSGASCAGDAPAASPGRQSRSLAPLIDALRAELGPDAPRGIGQSREERGHWVTLLRWGYSAADVARAYAHVVRHGSAWEQRNVSLAYLVRNQRIERVLAQARAWAQQQGGGNGTHGAPGRGPAAADPEPDDPYAGGPLARELARLYPELIGRPAPVVEP